MLTKLLLSLRLKTLYLAKGEVIKHESLFAPRSIVLLFSTSVCLLLLIGFYFSLLYTRCKETEREIYRLQEKTQFLVENRRKLDQFIKVFGKSDPAFLQKQVEPLQLLEKEIAFLTEVKKRGGAEIYLPIMERLAFLQSGQNKIQFIKKSSREIFPFHETLYTLSHPVEVDLIDLGRILSLTEGVKIDEFSPHFSRPQIIIKQIELTLIDEGGDNREYLLNLELLQRGCHEKNTF